MKKLLFLVVLLGLIGCGETDQNNTSQTSLQSSQLTAMSVNYQMASSASVMGAPVASFGQWVINGYTSEGASTILNANRTIGGVAIESKALITPNVSQVSKILRVGFGGAALTFAVNELLDGIDWVMDPANNQIRYKPQDGKAENGDWMTYGVAHTRAPSAYLSCLKFAEDANSNWPYVSVDVKWVSDKEYSCTRKYNSDNGSSWVGPPISTIALSVTEVPERTLPLDTVSQEIINNAEIGNTDAQAVTLAAAQAMVSEAENDATKAKEIEDEFERNSDEKCKNHNLKMNSKAAMVEWRYEELYKDRFNLYVNHKEVSNPFILNGNNKGSWDGHVSQYKYAQGVLRATIKTASNAGCPATPKANYWVNKEPPSQPGLHS